MKGETDGNDAIDEATRMSGQAVDETASTPDRVIVLVGMMGAGKSAIGKRLAERLGLDFVDADTEIERAADCTIAEIFERYGEASFRDGERRVIARLVNEGPCVLATGGGAFMDADTRALLKERALTVWLNADFDVLWERVSRRGHRPLLRTPDPKGTLRRLIEERYPVYAEADLTVASDRSPKDVAVDRVYDAVTKHVSARAAGSPPPGSPPSGTGG
jgi:shikimate kinase